MGHFGENLKDAIARSTQVKGWDERIAKTGMNRQDFCNKHSIDPAQMSRWITGKNGPEWDSITRVEEALKQENV